MLLRASVRCTGVRAASALETARIRLELDYATRPSARRREWLRANKEEAGQPEAETAGGDTIGRSAPDRFVDASDGRFVAADGDAWKHIVDDGVHRVTEARRSERVTGGGVTCPLRHGMTEDVMRRWGLPAWPSLGGGRDRQLPTSPTEIYISIMRPLQHDR